MVRASSLLATLFLLTALPTSYGAEDAAIVASCGGEPYGVIELCFSLQTMTADQADDSAPAASAPMASEDGADLEKIADRLVVRSVAEDPQRLKVLYPILSVSEATRWPRTSPSITPKEHQFELRALTLGTGPVTLDILDPASGRRFIQGLVIEPVGGSDEPLKAMLTRWGDAWRDQSWEDRSKWKINTFIPDYIASMVAARSGLANADDFQAQTRWRNGHDDDLELLELLTGANSLHLAMQTELMLGHTLLDEKANLPVPGDIELPEAEIPDPPAEVPVEQMALRVPHECFYLWTPSWRDFEWFLDQSDRVSRAVSANTGRMPADFHLREKLERQLAIERSLASRLLGPQTIESVALIGGDPFLREGAALGVLFKARNSGLLGKHIAGQRADARKDDDLVVERQVEIAGRGVSLLSRPDNRVRSFYLVDGDWHLVTNSRTLVERFIAVADGGDSLGASREFRWGRSKLALDRGDTLFLFLSDAFMRNLTGGRYRIEMNRRNLALNRIRLVRMATEVARNETGEELDLPAMIEAGYLPLNFNSSPDGSAILRNERGEWICSLRGAPGSFLPVCDVAVAGITPSEQQAWEVYKRRYQGLWENLDPTMIALRRGDDDSDPITVDLIQTPYPREQYEAFTRFFTGPTSLRIDQPSDNLLSAQVSISPTSILNAMGGRGNAPGAGLLGAMMMHTLFAGVQDFAMDLPDKQAGQTAEEYLDSFMNESGIEEQFRAYAGESPMPQLMLMAGAGAAEADAEGYFQFDEFWGRSMGNIHVLGTQRSVLEEVTPQLKVGKAERPAQVRLAAGRLDKRRITPWLEKLMILPALNGSASNARALSDAVDLLGVTPDQARTLLEELTQAELVCPLDGEFEVAENDDAPQPVISTAVEDYLQASGKAPGYMPQLVKDFRGGLLEFSVRPDQQILQVHLEFTLEH